MINIRANMHRFNSYIELFFIEKIDGKVFIAEPIKMKEISQHEFCEASFQLDINAAQVLMDELWQCGIRPSEGSGSSGALAATQKHLEDMRTLVFKK